MMSDRYIVLKICTVKTNRNEQQSENRKDLLQTRTIFVPLKALRIFSSHNGHNDFDESKIPHLKPPKNVAAVNKKQVTMKSTKASRAQSRQGDLQARPHDSLSQLKSRENPRTSTKHM